MPLGRTIAERTEPVPAIMRMAGKRAAFEERYHGAHGDKVFATSYESAIREAGFDVFMATRPTSNIVSCRYGAGG